MNAPNIFGDQDESLCRRNEHRRPTREGAYETNLYRTPNMKRYKLGRISYIENKSAISLLLKELGARQRLKFR